ncbi:hypothetical protein [Fluviispira multicolorata]|uniref:Beta-lactamase-related domain-containing protein n=1 Tax=Fluviispira multicolorata TaxID=2654512 RepID=A0A833JAV2_9BACT|nr:hypothetical protein [Fluviispira multicolorata]KAB8028455.1 hypothetical protein GCL57_12065 [Fluviispira multicolorata]
MKQARQKYLESHIPKNFIDCIDELENKVREGLFTAWSLANNDFQISCFWADESLPSNKKSEKKLEDILHPIFDLASLTKPLLINLYLRYLFKDDFLNKTQEPIVNLIQSERCDLGNKDLYNFFQNRNNVHFTLDSFLSHTSGAKSWHWMGSSVWRQKTTSHHSESHIFHTILDSKESHYKENVQINLNKKALDSLLSSQFGTTNYSDINYYILARLVEIIDIENDTWEKRIFFLNKYLHTNFMHASINSDYLNKCIPFYPYISSYNSEFSVQQIKNNPYGFVHDTNANILAFLGNSAQIVSGHAGLFGNICDVVKAVKMLSLSQQALKKSNTLKQRFIYGLDTPESKETSAGIKNWPIQYGDVYGHLGYTGTSFWLYNRVDKKFSEDFHILLTNRTSQRKKMGVDKCPRILIVSDIQNGKTHCFQIVDNLISSLLLTEAQEISLEYSGYSNRIWDTTVLRDLPNILDVRKFVAQKLWNI